MGGRLDVRERIVVFMQEHVSYLRNKVYRGEHGMTAFEGQGQETSGRGDRIRVEDFVQKARWKSSRQDQRQVGMWSVCGSEEKEQRLDGGHENGD